MLQNAASDLIYTLCNVLFPLSNGLWVTTELFLPFLLKGKQKRVFLSETLNPFQKDHYCYRKEFVQVGEIFLTLLHSDAFLSAVGLIQALIEKGDKSLYIHVF